MTVQKWNFSRTYATVSTSDFFDTKFLSEHLETEIINFDVKNSVHTFESNETDFWLTIPLSFVHKSDTTTPSTNYGIPMGMQVSFWFGALLRIPSENL